MSDKPYCLGALPIEYDEINGEPYAVIKVSMQAMDERSWLVHRDGFGDIHMLDTAPAGVLVQKQRDADPFHGEDPFAVSPDIDDRQEPNASW